MRRLQIVAGLIEQGQPTCLTIASRRWPTTRRPTTTSPHRVLHKAGIRPVIQNRPLMEGPYRADASRPRRNIEHVYDEAGTVYCYNRTSLPMVRQKMAYIGYEPQRETIKYRCPARHEGWPCPHDAVCNAGKSYGKTVRVDRTIDLRRFPPIPRATKKFERLYDGRTSVERVERQIENLLGRR